MEKQITLLLTLLLITVTQAQNEKPKREAFQLKLAIDSLHIYKQQIEETPYFVKENILQIYPSEKLNIEVEIRNDTIHSMKVVVENHNPDRTIMIDFKQEVKNRNNEMMLLSVKNPFDKTLTYKAHMFIVGRKKWIPTSIIPILPKLNNFEMWNDVIISLVLDNWNLESKK